MAAVSYGCRFYLYNGAYVHHLQTYARMQPTNVASVATLITLASTYKLKRIHFISTKYTAFTDFSITAFEGAPPVAPPSHFLAFGYTVTKWVAEWYLWKAQQQGVPVDIYRLGHVSGQSTTGISNFEKNNLTHFTVGCLQLGVAPKATDHQDMLPVDKVVQAITALSRTPYQQASAWHIINQQQLSYADYFRVLQDLSR